MIREAKHTDAEALCEIYNHYIRNTVITFEEEVVDAEIFRARIEKTQSLGLTWLVAIDNNMPVGYAYSSPWHTRSAYKHTVEISVYLSPSATSKGWGTKLYAALFNKLKETSIHVAIGGITLPNPASVALHEKFGMQQVAYFKEVGFKFDKWLDVGYWQVTLNSGYHST